MVLDQSKFESIACDGSYNCLILFSHESSTPIEVYFCKISGMDQETKQITTYKILNMDRDSNVMIQASQVVFKDNEL